MARGIVGNFLIFDKLFNDFWILGAEESVGVNEARQCIEVVHLLIFIDVGGIAKIDGFYMTENIVSQSVPIKCFDKLFLVFPFV